MVNIISLPATKTYENHTLAGLTAKTIYEINQFGDGVLVGGGNLYENGELDVNIEALQALEPPMMLFSLSRGRVYNRRHALVDRSDAMPKHVVQALNRKAKYSLARDAATHEFLLGIGCPNAILGGCPTITLASIADTLPKTPACATDVLISLRHPNQMSIPPAKQAQVRSDIAATIEALRTSGRRNVRLLCHDSRDLSFAATFPDIEYIYMSDVHNYLALLRSVSLNITYRLHSFLPCLALGTPAVSISYDERASSLLQTLGLEAWDINMVTSGNVPAQIMERVAGLDRLTALLDSAKPRWSAFTNLMRKNFDAFASDVRNYHAGAHP